MFDETFQQFFYQTLQCLIEALPRAITTVISAYVFTCAAGYYPNCIIWSVYAGIVQKYSSPRKIHLGSMKIISIQILQNRGNYFILCEAKVSPKSTSSHHDTASTYNSHNAQMTSSSQRTLQQNTLHSLVHNVLPAVITYSSQARKIVLKKHLLLPYSLPIISNNYAKVDCHCSNAFACSRLL